MSADAQAKTATVGDITRSYLPTARACLPPCRDPQPPLCSGNLFDESHALFLTLPHVSERDSLPALLCWSQFDNPGTWSCVVDFER